LTTFDLDFLSNSTSSSSSRSLKLTPELTEILDDS